MSVEGGSLLSRLLSGRGFTATSHYFVMDWASVRRELHFRRPDVLPILDIYRKLPT